MVQDSGLLSLRNIPQQEYIQFFEKIDEKSLLHPDSQSASFAGGLVFLEPSTRTRPSFERAGQLRRIDWIRLEPQNSSLSKGENLQDTFEVLAAHGIGFFVVRASQEGLADAVFEWTGLPVFNAGDGTHEHPTQALGDLLSIRNQFGDRQLRIAFYGDLARSRVLGSNLIAMKAMGYELYAVEGSDPDFTQKNSLNALARSELKSMDIVYCLRTQTERGGQSSLGPLRASDLGENTWLMHAGPVVVDRDLSSDLHSKEFSRSLISKQVRNCFMVRAQLMKELKLNYGG